MKQTVIVSHILTGAKDTFYNGLSLKENLTSSIIILRNETNNLLKYETREKYSAEVEEIRSKNGNARAYSQKYDLIAKFEGE
jgi:hypothetical protein